MNSVQGTAALPAVGFPIRTSPDQSLVSGSPTLFAATHVLLRLLSPRHPSCALCSLVISLPSSFNSSSRRPGSSAAPWLTGSLAEPTHFYCLLAHMQFSKTGARSLKTRQQAHVIARLHLTCAAPAVAGRRS